MEIMAHSTARRGSLFCVSAVDLAEVVVGGPTHPELSLIGIYRPVVGE
jgi:hypothetical protein